MNVFHQTGFRYQWNFKSFIEDKIGEGIIFSPVNIDAKKLEKLNNDMKLTGFFDPQIYLPKYPKSQLNTYYYFPTNIKEDFSTSDFDSEAL